MKHAELNSPKNYKFISILIIDNVPRDVYMYITEKFQCEIEKLELLYISLSQYNTPPVRMAKYDATLNLNRNEELMCTHTTNVSFAFTKYNSLVEK